MQRDACLRLRRHSLLGLLAAVGIASCGGEGRDQPTAPRNDVEFIDGMIQHHEGAVSMADEVIARGASGDVQRIAERMKSDQLAEIEHLRELRNELDGSATPALEAKDPNMKDDMAAMRGMSGEELDDCFLRDMIAHHAEAVMMSHHARPNLESEKTREMADTAFVKQTHEMDEMVDLLED